MAIKNLIFDWSGTISNDIRIVYDASMLIFKELGKEPITYDEFRRDMSGYFMDFWNSYFPSLTLEQEKRMFNEALEKVQTPQIYEGVKELLHEMHKNGMSIVVFSANPPKNLHNEAEKYGVKHCFKEINGYMIDKTEEIHSVMARNNFLPEETVYVGDSVHDIEAGKTANVKTVAITWGFQLKEHLEKAEPDHMIDDMNELREIIKLN